jgi:hypothetical protein
VKPVVLTIVLSCLLFGLFYWPLPAHWGSWIVGGNLTPTDGWMFVWNLWWVKTALLERGVSPLFTPDLFYPRGVSLGLHSLSLANGLLSVPLQALCGPIAAHNWLVLLSFALSAVGVYALARELGAAVPGAIAAGVAFSLCPYRVAHSVGHLNLVSTQWIPLTLWALLRLRRSPGIGYAALTTVFAVLAALSSWYYAIFVAVAAVPVLAFGGPTAGRPAWPWLLGSATVVWGVILLVLGRALVGAAAGQYGHGMRQGMQISRTFSADVVAYLVPSILHPYLKYHVAGLFNRLSGNWLESSVFPGYVMMVVAAWWFARGSSPRRTKLLIATVGTVALVLSLGPCLHVAGESSLLPTSMKDDSRWSGCVPLPYALLASSPLGGLARIPARWGLLVSLSLALAVACALGSSKTLSIAVAAVAAFEFLPGGVPVGGLDVPDFYRGLDGNGAVLELPVDLQMCSYTYLQTIHRRPLTYSHVSRLPLEALDLLGDIPRQLVSPGTHHVLMNAGVLRRPSWPEFLDGAGVGWVVLHLDRLRPDVRRTAPMLLKRPGIKLVAQEGEALLYRVQRDRPPTAEPGAQEDRGSQARSQE